MAQVAAEHVLATGRRDQQSSGGSPVGAGQCPDGVQHAVQAARLGLLDRFETGHRALRVPQVCDEVDGHAPLGEGVDEPLMGVRVGRVHAVVVRGAVGRVPGGPYAHRPHTPLPQQSAHAVPEVAVPEDQAGTAGRVGAGNRADRAVPAGAVRPPCGVRDAGGRLPAGRGAAGRTGIRRRRVPGPAGEQEGGVRGRFGRARHGPVDGEAGGPQRGAPLLGGQQRSAAPAVAGVPPPFGEAPHHRDPAVPGGRLGQRERAGGCEQGAQPAQGVVDVRCRVHHVEADDQVVRGRGETLGGGVGRDVENRGLDRAVPAQHALGTQLCHEVSADVGDGATGGGPLQCGDEVLRQPSASRAHLQHPQGPVPSVGQPPGEPRHRRGERVDPGVRRGPLGEEPGRQVALAVRVEHGESRSRPAQAVAVAASAVQQQLRDPGDVGVACADPGGVPFRVGGPRGVQGVARPVAYDEPVLDQQGQLVLQERPVGGQRAEAGGEFVDGPARAQEITVRVVGEVGQGELGAQSVQGRLCRGPVREGGRAFPADRVAQLLQDRGERAGRDGGRSDPVAGAPEDVPGHRGTPGSPVTVEGVEFQVDAGFPQGGEHRCRALAGGAGRRPGGAAERRCRDGTARGAEADVEQGLARTRVRVGDRLGRVAGRRGPEVGTPEVPSGEGTVATGAEAGQGRRRRRRVGEDGGALAGCGGRQQTQRLYRGEHPGDHGRGELAGARATHGGGAHTPPSQGLRQGVLDGEGGDRRPGRGMGWASVVGAPHDDVRAGGPVDQGVQGPGHGGLRGERGEVGPAQSRRIGQGEHHTAGDGGFLRCRRQGPYGGGGVRGEHRPAVGEGALAREAARDVGEGRAGGLDQVAPEPGGRATQGVPVTAGQ